MLATARQSHLEFSFPDASLVLLFDQGFVRQILLVYTDAMGMNEKQAYEKVRSQMKNMNIFPPLFARMILCDIGMFLNNSWMTGASQVEGPNNSLL